MKPFLSAFLFFPLLFGAINAQEAFVLKNADYSFSEWSADSPAGSYPPNLLLYCYENKDPKHDEEPSGLWTLAYNLNKNSRINGCGKDGISFVNTSDKNSGAGYAGSAVLSIDTRECSKVNLKYTATTLESSKRSYGLIAEYRIGKSGKFSRITKACFDSVQNKSSSKTYIIDLPDEAANKELVQIRWKYCIIKDSGETSGSRPRIALDGIVISKSTISDIDEVNSPSYRIDNDNIFISAIDDKSPTCFSIYNINGEEIYSAKFFGPEANISMSKFKNQHCIFVLIYNQSVKKTIKIAI
jgi:hypothetical protein